MKSFIRDLTENNDDGPMAQDHMSGEELVPLNTFLLGKLFGIAVKQLKAMLVVSSA